MTLLAPGAADPTAGDPQLSTPSFGQDSPAYRNMSLLANTYGGLPAGVISALGQSQTNPGVLSQVASAMDAVNPISQIYADPVLQKTPSFLTSARQYVNSTLGPAPIAQPHVIQIQRQLQKEGFAKGLNADGAWNPAWYAAQQQYAQALKMGQLAGNKPGSTTTPHAASWLNSFLPTHVADAIWGWAKAVPSDLHRAVGFVASAAAGLGTGIVTLDNEKKVAEVQNRVGRAILGGTSDPIFGKRGVGIENASWRQWLDEGWNIVNNALLLAGGAGAVTKVGEALGKAVTGGAVSEAGAAAKASQTVAQRGWQYFQQSKALDLTGKDFAEKKAIQTKLASDLGYADAARGPGLIANSINRSSQFLDSKLLSHFPILARTGPLISQLSDADGLYYRLRSLSAAPFEYAPVRVAGTAVGAASTLGVGARAAGAVGTAISPTDVEGQSVQHTHTFDAINDALAKRFHGTAFGVTVTPNINDLMFFLHPPADAIPHIVGGAVQGVLDKWDEALGKTGVFAEVARGMKTTPSKLIDAAGGNEIAVRRWLTDKLYTHAGYQWVEQQLNNTPLAERPEFGAAEDIGRREKLANEYWSNPTIQHGAIQSLLAQPFGLAARIRKEMADSALHGVDHNDLGTYAQTFEHMMTLKANEQELLKLTPEQMEATGVPAGRLGMVRTGNATFDSLQSDAANFDHSIMDDLPKRIRAASNAGNADRANALNDQLQQERNRLRQYLFTHLGKNAYDMSTGMNFTDNKRDSDLIQMIRDYSAHAPRVLRYAGPNGDVTAAMQKINDLGYTPVVGSHIGHTFDLDPELYKVLEGGVSWRRKAAEKLGLSPSRVSGQNVGAWRYANALHEMSKEMEKDDFHNAPFYDAKTVLSDVQNPKLSSIYDESKMAQLVRRVSEAFSLNPRKQVLDDLKDAMPGAAPRDVEERWKRMSEQMQGLQGIPRARFMDVMSRDATRDAVPGATNEAMMQEGRADWGPNSHTPLYSKPDAARLYEAMMRGANEAPAAMLGWQRAEDLIRGGFSLMGTKLDALPGEWGSRLANLPNKYVQLRNDLRFAFNPEFSLRRVVKTNFKMSMEGVVPTKNPLAALAREGNVGAARQLLTEIDPHGGSMATASEDIAKQLHGADVFHIFSEPDYRAYVAWQLHKGGATNDEINEKLNRIFNYGTYYGGTEGRTGLEKSANFMFFPFSFDKTVYRNLGAYLTSHMGQSMVLTAGLGAYDQWSKAHPDSALSQSWLDSHLPALQELAQLNMFAHGVGLGEFGGINAPVLNLLLPQVWSLSKLAAQDENGVSGGQSGLQTLNRVFPAAKEFTDLWKTVVNQQIYQVGLTSVGDGWDRIFKGETPAVGGVQWRNVQKAPVTSAAQYQAGHTEYLAAIKTFQPWLDYNATAKAGAKANFPLDQRYGNFAGMPITRQTIADAIHQKYPAFNPDAAASIAIEHQDQLNKYLSSLDPNDPKTSVIRDLVTAAQQGTRAMQNKNATAPQDAAWVDRVRGVATVLAESDAKFFKIWDQSFKAYYGPLEGVQPLNA